MSQYRRPGWWVLYVLVPLLAGLFVVEHRASLSPTGHRLAQVGIVLLIYGLVWLWLWANRLRLLWSDRGTSYQERVIAPRGAPISVPGAHLAPRQTHAIDIRARDRYRRVNLGAKGRGIRKCSANSDRRSSSWRSSH